MAGVKGSGSAGRAAVVAIFVAVGLLAMAPGAHAVIHLVGGSTQNWDFASNGYSYDTNWSPTQTFAVGDVLEFKYTAGRHDVVEYASKAEYDACSGAEVQKWQSGDDLVTLNSTGTKYYICSLVGHCTGGMKVSVTVAAASPAPTTAPASPPTTTPPPPGTASPPPPAGITPPPPPAGTTPPNAASSGPILSMAGLLAAALVAGLAFLV